MERVDISQAHDELESGQGPNAGDDESLGSDSYDDEEDDIIHYATETDDESQSKGTASEGNAAYLEQVETCLTAFYIIHKPDKVDDVPSLLEKYRGQEEELLSRLEHKYREPMLDFDQAVLVVDKHRESQRSERSVEAFGDPVSIHVRLSPTPAIAVRYSDRDKIIVLELERSFLSEHNEREIMDELLDKHALYVGNIDRMVIVSVVQVLKHGFPTVAPSVPQDDVELVEDESANDADYSDVLEEVDAPLELGRVGSDVSSMVAGLENRLEEQDREEEAQAADFLWQDRELSDGTHANKVSDDAPPELPMKNFSPEEPPSLPPRTFRAQTNVRSPPPVPARSPTSEASQSAIPPPVPVRSSSPSRQMHEFDLEEDAEEAQDRAAHVDLGEQEQAEVREQEDSAGESSDDHDDDSMREPHEFDLEDEDDAMQVDSSNVEETHAHDFDADEDDQGLVPHEFDIENEDDAVKDDGKVEHKESETASKLEETQVHEFDADEDDQVLVPHEFDAEDDDEEESHRNEDDGGSYRDRDQGEPRRVWKARIHTLDKAVFELIDSERSYFNDLETINDIVVLPLLEALQKRSIKLTQSGHETLLGLLRLWPRLTRRHRRLNEQMWRRCIDERRMHNGVPLRVAWTQEEQPLFACLEELEGLVSDFHLYDDYCMQYHVALTCFVTELASNKKLQRFLQQNCEGALRGGSLETYLIRPVQRICRYPLLLNKVLTSLRQGGAAPERRAFARTDQVVKEFSSLADQINKHKLHAEALAEMADIHSRLRFGQDEVGMSLAEPHRVLMRQGPLSVASGDQVAQRHVVLYNDVILLTVARKSWLNPTQKVYDVASALPLRKASVAAPQVKLPDLGPFQVTLTSPEWPQNELSFGAAREVEQNQWTEVLQESCEYATHQINKGRDTTLLDRIVAQVNKPTGRSNFVQKLAKAPSSVLRKFGDVHQSKAVLIQKSYRGILGRRRFEQAKLAFARESVLLVGRREVPGLGGGDSRVTQQVVAMPQDPADAAKLDAFRAEVTESLRGTDAAFVTLGVGAPSKVDAETLRFVDVTIPTEFAKGAKAAGVRHVAILTSCGADKTAKEHWLTGTSAGGGLYVQVKGKVEENLENLGFDSLSIFRPGMLLGSPNTPWIASTLAPLFDLCVPENFRSIKISDLAAAMEFDASRKLSGAPAGPEIFEGPSLFSLVARAKSAAAKAAAAAPGQADVATTKPTSDEL
ncbi:Oxidoreductase HTATIP2 [Durusdinium trenchii]|uniref:Oxidoreductase HTATIP2 n=1 Tax=Durusdinium trenchii TaxID=1381693 RepID=A0ABP0SMY2_9DINO